MSTARSGIIVSRVSMNWDGILAYGATSLASLLAGGGIVAKLFDYRQARLVAQIQETSKVKSEELLDRQKVTEDIHKLFLGVAHQNEVFQAQNETLRDGQIKYERRISKLESDNNILVERMKITEQLAVTDDVEMAKLRASNEQLDRRIADCERRWADFLKARDG